MIKNKASPQILPLFQESSITDFALWNEKEKIWIESEKRWIESEKKWIEKQKIWTEKEKQYKNEIEILKKL